MLLQLHEGYVITVARGLRYYSCTRVTLLQLHEGYVITAARGLCYYDDNPTNLAGVQ